MNSSVAIIGKVTRNVVKLPNGNSHTFAGGSGFFAAVSASFFSRTSLIGRTGTNLPDNCLSKLKNLRSIDIEKLEVLDVEANCWTAQYSDLSRHQTISYIRNFDDNGLLGFPISLPKDQCIYIGETDPETQRSLIARCKDAKVMLDTKIIWAQTKPLDLTEAIKRVFISMMNMSEAKQLFGDNPPVDNLMAIRKLGPSIAVLNLGANGSLLSFGSDIYSIPTLCNQPFETTGAGDTFGGAFISAIASGRSVKEAFIYGQVMSSFVIEDAGARRMWKLTKNEIQARYCDAEKLLIEQ